MFYFALILVRIASILERLMFRKSCSCRGEAHISWRIDVLSYGIAFHRKLDPKSFRLDARNALKSLKNIANVKIGWIGWTSSAGRGGVVYFCGAPNEVKSD